MRPRRPSPANPVYLHLCTVVLLSLHDLAVSGDVLGCPIFTDIWQVETRDTLLSTPYLPYRTVPPQR